MVDVMFPTSDGETLQGDLAQVDDPALAVVITHPHPLMGGDMYTPVPAGFFQAASTRDDVTALRFNFRGVGRSTGTHDKGSAERLDVLAAIAHIAEVAPGAPVVLAGWSFGADVSLTVDDERVAGWFLAAPPLRVVGADDMAASSHKAPKVLAIGDHDQYNDPASAQETTANWTNTTVEVIDGADHFFGPALPNLVAKFAQFLDEGVTT